jgi:K+-transporting ATPase ATPase C chain
MWQQLLPAFRMMLVLTALTGFIYPGIVTGICQIFFNGQANGSLISVNGQVVGSRLIGQNFTKPEYFQPRPSAAGDKGYDAMSSGAANYGPTNKKLIDRVSASIADFRKANPDFTGPIPADLLTSSASGVDPDISPASAQAQAARVAKARAIALPQVEDLIARHTQSRDLGFLGEPRVNVLEINLALDHDYSRK